MKHIRRARFGAAVVWAFAGAAALAGPVVANDNPVILQWFEARWADIERRMPDFFMAGYGGTWIPSPCRAGSSGSAGYDVFDRFDLGTGASPTAYGSEQGFRAVLGEFKRADGDVYLESILNHNSGRQGSASFQTNGGYPGFWMAPSNPIVDKTPVANWGDFHNGNANGYLQSENPNGANYDLFRGDLVALIDIAQESNNQFIRHPVEAGNPQNIPAGTIYNRPNPNNRRFYPDRQLTPMTVTNPGTSRNPGTNVFTFYPFNTDDPMQGDPVTDNTTGLLMRWTQWMLDEYKVDGFRLDAIKHVPSWFWDVYWDSVVHNRRVLPDGRRVTPYSFGESVESKETTFANYVRKDGFGNRDCLDITGSGSLRDLINAGGLGTWQTPLNDHLDMADDGDNNGSIGVNHVFSHDNGTTEGMGAAPANPTVRQMGYYANAYVLMRPGAVKLYHNARGISRPGGFWPDGGINTALGVDPVTNAADPSIVRLVQLHNFYARGEWNVLNSTDTVNPSLADALVFERRTRIGPNAFSGNVLVGVNDRYDAGIDWRSVQTSFPPGTRLLEMTGNAADAAVDTSNVIPEVLTVDSNRRVLIGVPRNRSSSGEHHKGYVVYGPAIPSGTLTFTGITSTIPADPVARPSVSRRINPIPVISTPTFEIQLTTTKGDPGAPNNDNADDNAVFRFNQGYIDLNGNGVVDIDGNNAVCPGYEQFVTQRQPLAGTSNTTGIYRQVIDASRLPEGFNYVSVIAFRKRESAEAPLFREFRQAIYIDRVGPAAQFVNPPTVITTTSQNFQAKMLDRTGIRAHFILDVPPGADPLSPTYSGVTTQGVRADRFDWNRTLTGLTHGFHTVTLTVFEESGRGAAYTHTFFVDRCPPDFNRDGFLDFFDLDDFVTCFESGACPPGRSADINNDGFVDFFDFDEYVAAFEAGC